MTRISRKRFLGGTLAGAIAAPGLYELVDRIVGAPARALAAEPPRAPEQHLLDLGTVMSEGVEVIVPPLHSEVVTATLTGVSDLKSAQRNLENVLRGLDATYPATAAGLGVTVAWGLPYFTDYVPTAWSKHAPHDIRAQKPALLPTRRFPSDPPSTKLERNDVAFLLRSDSLDHITAARTAIFALPFLQMTSIRRGFAGGGFAGKRSLPKKMAMAAGVPGADLVPDTAELFLGFTSTQKAGIGPGKIANFETLGMVDLRGGYFRYGTHMHVSHILEDLEAWYLNFDFAERVLTAFRPGMKGVKENAQTLPQGPKDASSAAQLIAMTRETGRFGHSASIQPTSRLQQDHVGADGTLYPKGTTIPQRADFNTLDNPFAWAAGPGKGRVTKTPAAGVHFVVFNPSSEDFERNRLGMDGQLPGGVRLPVAQRSRAQGFNSILQTTHRQNFLVPPRAHRSFPLAELS